MNYEEAKAQGFKYVTCNQLGGECVHKTKPERKGGYWESPGWRYIQDGTACPEKNVIMAINVAINIQNRQQEALKLAAQARKRAKKETRKRTGRRVCKTCKREFDTEHGSISYCSDLCMMIGKRRNNAKWKAKQRDEVPPELGALVTCKQCGQKFHRSRHYIAYCSNACREAARVAKRPMHSKTCAVCGTEFTTTDGANIAAKSANLQQTRSRKNCRREYAKSAGKNLKQHKAENTVAQRVVMKLIGATAGSGKNSIKSQSPRCLRRKPIPLFLQNAKSATGYLGR